MEAWIDQIRIGGPSVSQGPAAGASVRVVRDVEPLGVGDPLPDYVLTNQFGEAFHLTQYKGQALAITFLFTRCPFPTFCPRMADHFREAQQELTAMTDVAGNWHLLTVSFDPEFDRPAVLKAYAEGRQYKPARWTFATGSLVDVTALGDQLGLAFWRDEPGTLSHNLRTAVFDAGGRLQKVFAGNEWTVEELVNELRLAASRK
jgi:protein SCO1/2